MSKLESGIIFAVSFMLGWFLADFIVAKAVGTLRKEVVLTAPATTPVTVQQWECYATMKTKEATDGL